MRVAILGKGSMGNLIATYLGQEGFDVRGFVSENTMHDLSDCDVLLDFSNANKLPLLKSFLEQFKGVVIVGTTGYSEEEYELLKSFGKTHRLCYSSNYAIGIAILDRIIQTSMPYLKDYFAIELVEQHHKNKIEAPSGTTLQLLNRIKQFGNYKEVYGRVGAVGKRNNEEIGIHSLRGGSMPGEHALYFLGEYECIILKHQSFQKELYIKGVLVALDRLIKKPVGFYVFQDLLFEEETSEY